MLRCSLLLAVVSALAPVAARAQPAPARAHFPVGRPAGVASAPLPLPAGWQPVAPAAAPIPTVRAAAAYAPLPAAPAGPPPAEAPPGAPWHDLTGAHAGPPYDPYQSLPEEFRRRTLPAVWAEPVALRLLRGALGR